MRFFGPALTLLTAILAAVLMLEPPLKTSGAWERFLRDPVLAPIDREVSLTNLSISGSLPPHLVGGLFLRVGPNPVVVKEGQPYHWFDGDGMIYRLYFESSTSASLRSRWVHTSMYHQAKRDGRMSNLLGRFRYPWKTLSFLLGNMFSRDPAHGAANTALVFWKNRLFALYEGAVPFEVDPFSLESIGPFDFGGKLGTSFTAHPKIDAETGEMMFLSYFPPMMGQVNYYRATNVSSFESATITLPDAYTPRTIHDFGVTRTTTLWLDFPLEQSPVHSILGKPLILFKPNGNSHVGWHPRADPQKVQWAPIKPGYAFHVHAWDEPTGPHSVVVGCRARHVAGGFFDSDPPLEDENLDGRFPPLQRPVLYRWRLNRDSGNVEEGPLIDRETKEEIPCEFPLVDLKRTGLPQSFVFAPVPGRDVTDMHSIVKYNLETGEATYFSIGAETAAGEVFFVRDDTRAELDAGSLLVFVVDKANHFKTHVLVIDAQSMKQVARINFNMRIPAGFHTLFISHNDLTAE